MNSTNPFRGAQIRLTALTPADLPTMVCWYEDAGFLRLYDARPARPKSEAELARWLEELQKDKHIFAFDELNLHRVTATVFSNNERSIALFEKLGFRREGVYREFLQRDGRRYDMYLYGLLRPEWEAQNASVVGNARTSSGFQSPGKER